MSQDCNIRDHFPSSETVLSLDIGGPKRATVHLNSATNHTITNNPTCQQTNHPPFSIPSQPDRYHSTPSAEFASYVLVT